MRFGCLYFLNGVWFIFQQTVADFDGGQFIADYCEFMCEKSQCLSKEKITIITINKQRQNNLELKWNLITCQWTERNSILLVVENWRKRWFKKQILFLSKRECFLNKRLFNQKRYKIVTWLGITQNIYIICCNSANQTTQFVTSITKIYK